MMHHLQVHKWKPNVVCTETAPRDCGVDANNRINVDLRLRLLDTAPEGILVHQRIADEILIPIVGLLKVVFFAQKTALNQLEPTAFE
jgi:hypothetical protein